MNPDLLRFFIVCPAVFVAGYIDAIAGGGGLITIPAYILSGLPVNIASGTNKFGVFFGTGMAACRYGKYGYIRPRAVLVGVPCAVLGSMLGARLQLAVPEGILKAMLLVVLPVVAFYAFKSKKLEGGRLYDELPQPRTNRLLAAISFGIGIYDGFYGPGTGTFLLLLLTGVAHMDLNESNGTAKAINLATNLGSLIVFISSGKVIYPLGCAAAVCSIAGNYLGAASFKKKGAALVRPVILIVLALFFIKVIQELLFK